MTRCPNPRFQCSVRCMIGQRSIKQYDTAQREHMNYRTVCQKDPCTPWSLAYRSDQAIFVIGITFRSDACFRAQAPQTVGDNHGAQSAFSLAEHASCTGDPLTTECVVAKSSCSAVNPSILSGSYTRKPPLLSSYLAHSNQVSLFKQISCQTGYGMFAKDHIEDFVEAIDGISVLIVGQIKNKRFSQATFGAASGYEGGCVDVQRGAVT